MDTETVKQVIIIRRDLKMRRGKEIAQGAHAAMGWLLQRMTAKYLRPDGDPWAFVEERVDLTAVEKQWVNGNFRKVVCQVNSEQELFDLYAAAGKTGLVQFMVRDQGATEFHGVETVTALAIGPDYAEKIDPITQHLKLY